MAKAALASIMTHAQCPVTTSTSAGEAASSKVRASAASTRSFSFSSFTRHIKETGSMVTPSCSGRPTPWLSMRTARPRAATALLA
eukprot:781316-Pyramimonas_sp.AAC.1